MLTLKRQRFEIKNHHVLVGMVYPNAKVEPDENFHLGQKPWIVFTDDVLFFLISCRLHIVTRVWLKFIQLIRQTLVAGLRWDTFNFQLSAERTEYVLH